MVQKHLPGGGFLCLTNQELNCPTEKLIHNWPGWWSKLELFRIQGPLIYFDLDTVLRADCRAWAERVIQEEFVILRDPYRGKRRPNSMGSGIMAWRKNMSYVYEAYKVNPEFDIQHGDQGFVEQIVCNAKFLQDFTDTVVSFKADILEGFPIDRSTVVYFHGEPRPWDQKLIPY